MEIDGSNYESKSIWSSWKPIWKVGEVNGISLCIRSWKSVEEVDMVVCGSRRRNMEASGSR